MAHEKRPPSSHSSLSPPPLSQQAEQPAADYSSSSSDDEDMVDETSSIAWMGVVGGNDGGLDESLELGEGGSSGEEAYTVRVSGVVVVVVACLFICMCKFVFSPM